MASIVSISHFERKQTEIDWAYHEKREIGNNQFSNENKRIDG